MLSVRQVSFPPFVLDSRGFWSVRSLRVRQCCVDAAACATAHPCLNKPGALQATPPTTGPPSSSSHTAAVPAPSSAATVGTSLPSGPIRLIAYALQVASEKIHRHAVNCFNADRKRLVGNNGFEVVIGVLNLHQPGSEAGSYVGLPHSV